MNRSAAVCGNLGAFGEGIPMWNGFVKVTAMVGVIGVGLVAVFYAQKNMNPTMSGGTTNQVEPRAGTDDSELLSEDATHTEPSSVDSEDIELVKVEKQPQDAAKPRGSR